LIERPDIRPSPYLGRHHWVVFDRLDAVRAEEMKEWIRQSYEMVDAKAPPAAPRKKATKIRTKAGSEEAPAGSHAQEPFWQKEGLGARPAGCNLI
jgi:hypothetical protein